MRDKAKVAYILGSVFNRITSVLYGTVITAYLLNCHLDMLAIGTIWSIVIFTQMITDYPTGGFADRFGRLKIYLLGMVFMGSARILISQSHSLWIFYLAAVLIGFGESQISGTLMPWFIDLKKGKDGEFPKEIVLKTSAQRQYISNLCGICIGFIISFIHLNYSAILLLAGIIQILGGLFIYCVFEDNRGEGASMKEIGVKSLLEFKNNRRLWIYTMLFTVVYCLSSVYMFLWQPRGVHFGISGSALGMISSLSMVAAAIGAVCLKYIKKLKVLLYIISSIMLPGSLVILFLNQQYRILFLITIVLYGFSSGVLMPYLGSTMQYTIKNNRSAVASLVSSLSSVLLVAFQVIIGGILDSGNFWGIMACIGIIGFILIVLFLNILRWVEHETTKRS